MPQSGMTAPPRGEPSVPASIAAKSVARRSRKKVRLTTKFASVHGRALGSPSGRAGETPARAARLRGEALPRAGELSSEARLRGLLGAAPVKEPKRKAPVSGRCAHPARLDILDLILRKMTPSQASNIPSSSQTSCLGTLAQSKSGKRLSGVRGAGSGCRP